MLKSGKPPKGGKDPIRHQGRAVGVVVVIFFVCVLAYSFMLLREQTASSSAATPLEVRTDLMPGRPCHVANEVIMGNCSAEEIAALQDQAQSSSTP